MLSMVEQADTRKCHGNIIFITCFNNIIISDTSACLSNILYTAAVSLSLIHISEPTRPY